MPHYALIGHPRTLEIAMQLIRQYHPDIAAAPFEMSSMRTADIIAAIRAGEDAFDGILFTCKSPFDLINAEMISQKPWAYLNYDTAHLTSLLLQASVTHNYDISAVSIDSYSADDVGDVYRSLCIPAERLNLHLAKGPLFRETYIDDIKAFHEQCYNNKGVSFCITGISDVYQHLLARSIPCLPLNPTKRCLDAAIRRLNIKQGLARQENSHIVVLAIERDLPSEYALIHENEYQLALESMKISEEIYLFSQRIQAAVIEREIGKYLLFTTQTLLELETDSLKNIRIITQPDVRRFSTLSIGIGYGKTAREAKYNANLGLLKAKKHGGNRAYKVENNEYIGPITPSVTEEENAPYLDGPFQEIALESGISINSVLKLQAIIDRQKKNAFTSNELARLFGVSSRSMNRMLSKLLDSNHAKIVGCNMRTQSGRPSRIIRLF